MYSSNNKPPQSFRQIRGPFRLFGVIFSLNPLPAFEGLRRDLVEDFDEVFAVDSDILGLLEPERSSSRRGAEEEIWVAL